MIVQGLLATPAHTLRISVPAPVQVCKIVIDFWTLNSAHNHTQIIVPAPNCVHTLKDRILNSTNALTLVGSFERS